MILFIALIVAIIILINENNELKKEIVRLKAELASALAKVNNNNNVRKQKNYAVNGDFFCPMCGKKNDKTSNGTCVYCGHILDKIEKPTSVIEPAKVYNKKVVRKEKPVRNVEETRNNAILITGAILIILSAHAG